MKKLLIYLSIPLLLSGCADLLEEAPKGVAVETFYKTAEEVETAVNAIYSPLRNVRPEQICILDAHTDWGFGRGSRAQYNDFTALNSTNINTAGSRWSAFYLGIRNANLVIANVSGNETIDPAVLSQYVAEAKFLRAWAYFDLVRNWGGVPLRTDANLGEPDVPRSSEEDVYAFILADLEEAEANLPDQPTDIGRPSKLAAKTLLADVYLQLGRFQEAREKSNEVIQSGEFSLVPISSFEDIEQKIFGPELLTSTEEIFYMKYSRIPGQGNYILWILNHPSTGLFNYGGAYAHYGDASGRFFTEWNDDDIRKQLWDKVDFGLGPNTLVSKKYIDQNAVERNNGAGNDLPIYRYSEVLLQFAEADCRVAGGPTPAGMEALNKVHRRAYGYDPGSPSPVDFNIADYDEESFADLVLQERAYEFQFEGKRWQDLKRTGKAAEIIMRNRGLTIAEAHYLWPIPLDEMNFNDAMDPQTDQNPGY